MCPLISKRSKSSERGIRSHLTSLPTWRSTDTQNRRASSHMRFLSFSRRVGTTFPAATPGYLSTQNRDLAAISPTGTGKTLSYLLPTMIALGSPNSKGKKDFGSGARALIIAPTRELAHQIHNECLKLAEGRKWRMTLFSKATASTLADKNVRDKVGEFAPTFWCGISFS